MISNSGKGPLLAGYREKGTIIKRYRNQSVSELGGEIE